MSFTFRELDGKKMKVSEFLDKRALMPSPLKIFLVSNDVLIKVGLESLDSIPNLVGEFTVYEDNDGTMDNYVIIRKELWFIINLDEVK